MPLPHMMRAIEIADPGETPPLRLTERPIPTPGPGDVLIAVEAAGINRADLLQCAGLYPPPAGASDLPGLEVAGTIVAIGRGVDCRRIGEHVTALVTGGGYAEYCLAPAQTCLPLPDGLSAIEAAALPEAWFTVWDHLIETCRLSPGETLLVHGGTSGIGITALQLARLIEVTAFATVGSDAKAAWLGERGYADAVNYRSCDFVEALLARTEGRGVDVVLDMVGGTYLARNIALMAEGGRISQIATQGGSTADGVELDQIMLKRISISGNTLRTKPIAYKARLAANLRSCIWPYLGPQGIRPVVHTTFPLHEAATAHRLMESSLHIGKLVLTVDQNENRVDVLRTQA